MDLSNIGNWMRQESNIGKLQKQPAFNFGTGGGTNLPAFPMQPPQQSQPVLPNPSPIQTPTPAPSPIQTPQPAMQNPAPEQIGQQPVVQAATPTNQADPYQGILSLLTQLQAGITALQGNFNTTNQTGGLPSLLGE